MLGPAALLQWRSRGQIDAIAPFKDMVFRERPFSLKASSIVFSILFFYPSELAPLPGLC